MPVRYLSFWGSTLPDWRGLPSTWISTNFVPLFSLQVPHYPCCPHLKWIVSIWADIVLDTLLISDIALPNSRVLRFCVKFLLHFLSPMHAVQSQVHFRMPWELLPVQILLILLLFQYRFRWATSLWVWPFQLLVPCPQVYLRYRNHLPKSILLSLSSCLGRDIYLDPIDPLTRTVYSN